MLHEFLTVNRPELISRCVAKVAKRPKPKGTPQKLEHGIPLFIDQLIKTVHRSKLKNFELSTGAWTTQSPMPSRNLLINKIVRRRIETFRRRPNGCKFSHAKCEATLNRPRSLLPLSKLATWG